MTEPPLDSQRAKLELNSRLYKFDANLERYADMFADDVAAWQRLPVHVQDASGWYMDARAAYKAALAAGAIEPDPATPVN